VVVEAVRMLYQVLVLVRFSLLLGVVCALVMLLNDQAQDVLRRGVERRRRLVAGEDDVLSSASAIRHRRRTSST
jgi:hypothetical protein